MQRVHTVYVLKAELKMNQPFIAQPLNFQLQDPICKSACDHGRNEILNLTKNEPRKAE